MLTPENTGVAGAVPREIDLNGDLLVRDVNRALPVTRRIGWTLRAEERGGAENGRGDE
jgi:hypothetical protein